MSMPELQKVKSRRETTLTLLNLVRNVKALAAVTIREQQTTAAALCHYEGTLEKALGAVLRRDGVEATSAAHPHNPGAHTAQMVLGSDRGMCGAFNQKVAREVESVESGPLVAVGYRVGRELEKRGFTVLETLSVPSGAVGRHGLVGNLLVYLEEWNRDPSVGEVVLHLNAPHRGKVGYAPVRRRLLPLGSEWLDEVQAKPWVSRSRPKVLGPPKDVFQTLLRQWLYVTVYRAVADSMVAESGARLATMQNAENNINGKLETLEREFRSLRQSQIDAELLDISAGFEAVVGEQ
jgi:F-type H+-transporting ATPase subunit gamma